MGATTAMVLIGSPTWDLGINVDHTLHLVEGDRAKWVLLPSEHSGRIVWDVRPTRLVDDVLALIGVHVLGHPVSEALRAERLSLYELDGRAMEELGGAAAATRAPTEAVQGGKFTIISFHGSTLESQLHEFGSMTGCDLEICTPRYSTWYSPFDDSWRTVGALVAAEEDDLEGP